MRRTLVATVSALGAAVLSSSPVLWSPAVANTTTGGDEDAPGAVERTVVEQATTATAQRRVVEYWTPTRMRSATPGDAIVADRDTSLVTGRVAIGRRTVVGGDGATRPDAGDQNRVNATQTGEYYTGAGDVVDTTGKLFFTLGGVDYGCSGSATASDNGDLVLTAGHCVNEGPGDYATNVVFVPGYDDGARPHGTFTARRLVTTRQWKNTGDFDYDIGFAVMNPRQGADLTETVGAQSVGFNLARGQYAYAFGYPAADPYDGTDLAWCHGRVVQDTYHGSRDQGLRCDMTGGSSGGPWFVDYDEESGTGTLNSVNSFGYRGVDDVMWGPYFGTVAQRLHSFAEHL